MATRDQVRALRHEAYEAGDFFMAAVCEIAMDRFSSAIVAAKTGGCRDRLDAILVEVDPKASAAKMVDEAIASARAGEEDQ